MQTLSLLDQLKTELDELGAQDLYRKCRIVKPSGKGPYAEIDGQKVTLFCGNDYLGLSQNPRVIDAAIAAAKNFGTGAGAARLISGTSHLHAELESEIAKLKKKESALVYSAGFLGNIGVLSSLAGKE